MPLQMVLRNILLQNETQAVGINDDTAIKLIIMMRYSLIIISTVPMMLFYPFIQKHFTKGVMIGSVKG
jgi:ABC-type glycerol-3-phosphate transport system permease component